MDKLSCMGMAAWVLPAYPKIVNTEMNSLGGLTRPCQTTMGSWWCQNYRTWKRQFALAPPMLLERTRNGKHCGAVSCSIASSVRILIMLQSPQGMKKKKFFILCPTLRPNLSYSILSLANYSDERPVAFELTYSSWKRSHQQHHHSSSLNNRQ